jgi:2-polyprenyl-3-methyl-5-hydroxy-6-metoxy-1,4-benzoquinol methylase
MNSIKSQSFYKNEGNMEVLKAIPKESKFILDVGCGAGDNARILNAQKKVVDCITISEKEARIVKSICRKVFIYDLENGLPEIDQKYDVILCSHVIEHIAYPEKLLSDIKKVMHDNSVLIIALPNFLGYKTRFKILLGNFDYEQGGIMDYTHLRFYTYKTGRKLLENNEFIVQKSWVQGFLPFNSILKFLPPFVKNLIIRFLIILSKGLFGSQLIYIAKRK